MKGNTPRFLFRIDASAKAGTGHLRRCLTIAEELKSQGADVFFACRVESFPLEKFLENIATGWEEYDWNLTPEEDAWKVVDSCRRFRADSVIVDHYRANEIYQKILYDSGLRWLQFDGAAGRPCWADWVLNISPTASEGLYEGLRRRKKTRFLLGTRYAPLRREFRKYRIRKPREKDARAALLTFGGGDDRGAAVFCLQAIHGLENADVTVLLSSANPRMEEILHWNSCHGKAAKVVVDAETPARYMASADVAITAGGMTVFELAALGIPALILQIADNQVPIAKAWQEHGYGINLGGMDRLRPEDLRREMITLLDDADRRKAMSAVGRKMVDGLGAGRVAEALLAAGG